MLVATLIGLLAVAPFFVKAQNDTESNVTCPVPPGFETVWGYTDQDGPQVNESFPDGTPSPWPNITQTGKNQSPININSSQVTNTSQYDAYPLTFFGHNVTNNVTIINDGHSLIASGFNLWGDGFGSQTPYISHGGLSTKYNLVNFQLHWGADDNDGSEHQIDGNPHSMELHYIYQKSTYTAAQASANWDGLAIFAVLFDLSGTDGSAMSQMQTAYNSIDNWNSSTPQNVPVRLDQMMPSNTGSFYRYNGSLTTPPCTENVIWTIFTTTRTTTSAQLANLRKHFTQKGDYMTENHRDPMNPENKLNGRTVLMNQ